MHYCEAFISKVQTWGQSQIEKQHFC